MINSNNLYVSVLREAQKHKNHIKKSNSFPSLRSIVFIGCVTIVACLAVLYLADPSFTADYFEGMLGLKKDDQEIDNVINEPHLTSYEDSYYNTNLLSDTVLGRNSTFSDAVKELNYRAFEEIPMNEFKEGLVHLNDFAFIWKRPMGYRNGTEAMKNSKVNINGLVVIANACGRPSFNWWHKSHLCPYCKGLPLQERVATALADAGFAVVALSPVHNKNTTQCWNLENDRKYVKEAIRYVLLALGKYSSKNNDFPTSSTPSRIAKLPEKSLTSLPLLGFGVQSGAHFLSEVAPLFSSYFNLPFSAFCLVNFAFTDLLNRKARSDAMSLLRNSNINLPLPPIMFVDPVRNSDLVEINREISSKIMPSKGVPSLHFISQPRYITENFFTDGNCLNEKQSRAFQRSLMHEDLVDKESMLLLKDPVGRPKVQKRFKELARLAAPKVVPRKDPVGGLQSGILQLLNVAWAQREVYGDEHIAQIIAWYNKHRQVS